MLWILSVQIFKVKNHCSNTSTGNDKFIYIKYGVYWLEYLYREIRMTNQREGHYTYWNPIHLVDQFSEYIHPRKYNQLHQPCHLNQKYDSFFRANNEMKLLTHKEAIMRRRWRPNYMILPLINKIHLENKFTHFNIYYQCDWDIIQR